MSLDSLVLLCWIERVLTQRSIDKVDDGDGVGGWFLHHFTAVLPYGSASFSLAAIYAFFFFFTFHCGVMSVE